MPGKKVCGQDKQCANSSHCVDTVVFGVAPNARKAVQGSHKSDKNEKWNKGEMKLIQYPIDHVDHSELPVHAAYTYGASMVARVIPLGTDSLFSGNGHFKRSFCI